jgi:hypothetical protein
MAPAARGSHGGRLRAKLALAAQITGEIANQVEARADALIARRTEISALAEKSFRPHEELLDATAAGLDQVAEALTELGHNGGPAGPLPGSPASSQQ